MLNWSGRLGVVAALALASVAQAQPAAPAESYTLKITRAEIEIIGEALGGLPFNRVNNLIANLRKQIEAEEAERAKPKEEAKPKE